MRRCTGVAARARYDGGAGPRRSPAVLGTITAAFRARCCSFADAARADVFGAGFSGANAAARCRRHPLMLPYLAFAGPSPS